MNKIGGIVKRNLFKLLSVAILLFSFTQFSTFSQGATTCPTSITTLVYFIGGVGGGALGAWESIVSSSNYTINGGAFYNYIQNKTTNGVNTTGVNIEAFPYSRGVDFTIDAAQFNNQLLSDVATYPNVKKIYIFTHSEGTYIPRVAVLQANQVSYFIPSSLSSGLVGGVSLPTAAQYSQLKSLYKNEVTIVQLNPLLGGEEIALKLNAMWCPLVVLGELNVLTASYAELDPQSNFQTQIANNENIFKSSISAYAAYSVFGDMHLQGVWLSPSSTWHQRFLLEEPSPSYLGPTNVTGGTYFDNPLTSAQETSLLKVIAPLPGEEAASTDMPEGTWEHMFLLYFPSLIQLWGQQVFGSNFTYTSPADTFDLILNNPPNFNVTASAIPPLDPVTQLAQTPQSLANALNAQLLQPQDINTACQSSNPSITNVCISNLSNYMFEAQSDINNTLLYYITPPGVPQISSPASYPGMFTVSALSTSPSIISKYTLYVLNSSGAAVVSPQIINTNPSSSTYPYQLQVNLSSTNYNTYTLNVTATNIVGLTSPTSTATVTIPPNLCPALPANATQCPGTMTQTSVIAPTSWSLVQNVNNCAPTSSPVNCQAHCQYSSGYVLNSTGTACVVNNCPALPANSTLCPGSITTLVPGGTNWNLVAAVGNCAPTTSPTYCQAHCQAANGYVLSGNNCVKG